MVDKQRIMISIPADLLSRLDARCATTGESRSGFINHVIADTLNLEERTLAIAQKVLNDYANNQLFGDDDAES